MHLSRGILPEIELKPNSIAEQNSRTSGHSPFERRSLTLIDDLKSFCYWHESNDKGICLVILL